MAHKNRFLRIVTSLLLAVLIGGLLPAQVLADARPEYISELRIGYDSDEEDAYQSLVDEGFTVMTYNTGYVNDDVSGDYENYADLNQGGSSKTYIFRKGSAVVYLGYKTTTNKDEAITDIVAMEMNGNYSFVDYQNLLNKVKDTQLMPFIAQFSATLREYRENYRSGNAVLQAKAQYAHDTLNKLTEDDSGMPLGDLLLNETKEEMGDAAYTALGESEQKNHADLCKILLQGNQLLIPQIKLLVAAAADTAENNWLDRLAAVTEQDLIRDKAEETGATQADVMAILADEYGATAQKLGDMWEALRSRLLQYMNENDIEYVSHNEEAAADEDLPAGGEVLPDEGEDLPDEGEDLTDEGGAAQTASSVTEPDGYTSVADMSEEELSATLDLSAELELPENADADDAEEAIGNYVEKTQDLETRLVYEALRDKPCGSETLLDYFLRPAEDVTGENLSALYPLAAALSDGQKGALEAVSLFDLARFALSGEGYAYSDEVIRDALGGLETVSVYAGVDRTVFSGGTALTQDALRKDPEAVLSFWGWRENDEETLRAWNYFLAASAVGAACLVYGAFYWIWGSVKLRSFHNEWSLADIGFAAKAYKDIRLGRSIFAIGAFFAVGGLLIYLDTLLSDLKTYYTVEFKTIPQHLINERDVYETDANGNRKLKLNAYAFYDAVECNRTQASEDWEKLKNYGDLNGDVGRQWIALYTTKNPDLGEPILASSLKTVVGNADLPADYQEGLKLSGANSFLNLTDDHYTYNNETGGIYLYWQRAQAQTVTGGQASAISGGTLALSAGGGFLAGGALGACVLSVIKKKKKTAA